MNHIPSISKITERGQITLPKHVRETTLFKGAHAVEFTQEAETIVIRPIRSAKPTDEHLALFEHSMRDWTHPENDNLFDFS